MPAAAPEKRLEWSRRALDAHLAALERIADEDAFTAERFAERVERALAAVLAHPGIGTPATQRGERRFPIPKTGHVVNYRVTRSAVRIQV
jgi:plasmid stabilization system protein ParE